MNRDSATISPTLEELLSHAGWLRRLAGSLLRDADAAAELVQETLITAWQRPPAATGDSRAWLARVMRNRTRDWLRGKRRRVRHEQDAAEAAAAGRMASAADLIGDLEVHRMVAEVVSGLEEPFREAVVLHFYEGLPSAETARRLGIPSGTVRWRVKQGLDRVRERLDERCGGDRRRWVRALLPLVPELAAGSSAAGVGSVGPAGGAIQAASARPRALPLALALGATALGLTGIFAVRCTSPRWDHRGAASGGSVAGVGTFATVRPQAGSAPRLGDAGPALPSARPAFADLAACLRDLPGLRAQAAAAEHAWLRVVQAGVAFSRGGPNPTAERALEPIVASVLDPLQAAGSSYRFECRTWACRVVVVEPTDELAVHPNDDWVSPLLARLHQPARVGDAISHVDEAVRDPLTGAPLGQQVTYVKLVQPSGEPASTPTPAATPSPLPSTHAGCEIEVATLHQQLLELNAETARHLGPSHRFDEKRPNPRWTAEVRRQIERALPDAASRPPFTVDCRDQVCRLRTPKTDVDDLWLELDDDEWFRTRIEDFHFSRGGMYLHLAERPRPDGPRLLRELLDRIARAASLRDCGHRHRQPGRLKFELTLFGGGMLARMQDTDEPVGLVLKGDLADRPLGACVRMALEHHIAQAALPADAASAAVWRWVTFTESGDWTWREEE